MEVGMIIRAKTDSLIQTRELTEERKNNTKQNKSEIQQGSIVLKSKPQRLVFEMTNACNLNCVMCGRNAAEFKATSFDVNWLPYFDNIAEHVEEVTLMGWGEPTIHPQFVDFLKWANKHGLRKYFCTNGMKLDKLIDVIFEQEVDVIAISLDGATPESNAAIRRGADFDKIMNSLRAIVAEKKRRGTPFPYMNFVTTLMKSNLHEFPKIVELAADIGLDEAKGVYLTVFNDDMIGNSLFESMDEVKSVFNEAEEIATKHGLKLKIPHLVGEDSAGEGYHKPCHTAWRDFFLGSDGLVRSCMSTAKTLFPFEKYKTFEDAWNSDEFTAFRKKVNEDSLMENSCKNCYQSSFANWNRKSAFNQVGLEFSPDWK